MKKKINWQPVRYLVQGAFVAYLIWFAFAPVFFKNIYNGSLHGICPFSAVETMPILVSSGFKSFVRGASPNSLIILGSFILAIIAGGAAFCGWMCPVGTLSEWIGNLGKKIFKHQYKVPEKLHKALVWLRFVMLGVVLVMCYLTASLWFSKIDPFINIFSLKIIGGLGLIVAIVMFVGSLAIERFFCLYLCPAGASIKIFAYLAAMGIKRNKQTCTSCKACDKACPKRIPVSTQIKVDRSECISCMKCVQACPVKGTLDFEIGW